MRVVILHEVVDAAARADEADVLDQVAAVAGALDELGYPHSTLAMTRDFESAVRELRALAPDVVFNLVESLDGSGRLVDEAPAMLEQMGLPCTGSGKEAMRHAASKLLSKQILTAGGLPTPDCLSSHDLRAGAPVPLARYILKSVWEHGSLGLEEDCVVTAGDPRALYEQLERRLGRLGGEAFAEAYVDGREFNLAMLADDAGVEHLPPAEIRFDAVVPGAAEGVHIVGYGAKWHPGSAADVGTPRSFERSTDDADLIVRMQSLAQATWDAFDLRGYARVDFRVDRERRPWIIDVNTNPCLSADAGFAAALQQARIPFARAINRILQAACSRP